MHASRLPSFAQKAQRTDAPTTVICVIGVPAPVALESHTITAELLQPERPAAAAAIQCIHEKSPASPWHFAAIASSLTVRGRCIHSGCAAIRDDCI